MPFGLRRQCNFTLQCRRANLEFGKPGSKQQRRPTMAVRVAGKLRRTEYRTRNESPRMKIANGSRGIDARYRCGAQVVHRDKVWSRYSWRACAFFSSEFYFSGYGPVT